MIGTSTTIFIAASKTIFTGTLAYSIVRAMNGKLPMEEMIFNVCVGFLGILFFRSFYSTLGTISDGLVDLIFANSGYVPGDDFFKSIVEAGNTSILNGYAQMLKVGVWVIFQSIVNLVFVISRELLIAAREVLWHLCALLFPLAAAFSPVYPGILKNIILYSVEIALWIPVLTLCDAVISMCCHDNLIINAGTAPSADLGLSIVAIQLISVILIFTIPAMTHKIVNGAMNGDHGIGPSGVIAMAVLHKERVVNAAKTVDKAKGHYRAQAQKAKDASINKKYKNGLALVFLLFLPCLGFAQETARITLFPGFVSKVQCRGDLRISAVGNERLVKLEALPKQIGCGVILKPLAASGETNLILETSTGSHKLMLDISKSTARIQDLETDLGAGK